MRIFTPVVVSSIVLAACCSTQPVQKGTDSRLVPDKSRVYVVSRPAAVYLGKKAAIRHTDFKISSFKLMQARSVSAHEGLPPSFWPNGQRWKPLRHFGPFHSGSNLDEITAKLDGLVPSVVYNQFFVGHPDAGIYLKYYGPILPSNEPSTTLPQIPGDRTTTGFNTASVQLEGISYSSRYGGSVRLAFHTTKDYGVEFWSGNMAWDIKDLGFTVYVNVVPADFNPNSRAVFNYYPLGLVHTEFAPSGVTGYQVIIGSDQSRRLIPTPEASASSLDSALIEAGKSFVNNPVFRMEVSRFVHAYLHTQFWDDIGQTNTVSSVEISDGFFLPHTQPGRGYAVVSIQIANVNLDTEPGGEEIHVTAVAQHMYSGLSDVDYPGVTIEFEEIDNHESTPFATIGVFSLDSECPRLLTIIFQVSAIESDSVLDDRFYSEPGADQMALECGVLNDLFTSGQFGLASEERRDGYLLMQNDEVKGAYSVVLHVAVYRF